MDNLLTIDDFVGSYNIPNKTGIGISDALDALVSEHQEPFFTELLGVKLYNAMVSDYSLEVLPDKWKKLMDGDTISQGNDDYTYRGALLCFKAFMFYKWMEYSAKVLQGVGMVAPAAENGKVITPEWAMSGVWHSMLSMRQSIEWNSSYISVMKYIELTNLDTPGTYPDFKFTWYFGINPLVTW